MPKIDDKNKDLRMMGMVMGMPLYLDVQKHQTEEEKLEKELEVRQFLYHLTNVAVRLAEQDSNK